MAAVCSLRNISALRRFTVSPSLRPVQACRFISTSDKKQDGATPKADVSNLPDLPKTWASWGFNSRDYYKDRAYAHIVFFSTISIATVAFGYVLYYYPDVNNREWNRREAFLELRRREAAGLPLVDPNYVPVSQIKLPSDEELGNFDIII